MIKFTRYAYTGIAWLFVVGVIVQVFLAGMVVVAVKMGWNNHITLGHSLGGPLILLLISMYLGRMPGSIKKLTWLLFGVYVLQADVLIFLRMTAPVLAAFHPVMALLDFAIGLNLARRSWALVQEGRAQKAIPAEV